jgi:hypothetical protein
MNDLLILEGNKRNFRVYTVKQDTSLHDMQVENGVVNLSAKIELLNLLTGFTVNFKTQFRRIQISLKLTKSNFLCVRKRTFQ